MTIILSLLLCVYILKGKDLRRIRFKAKLLKVFEVDIEAESHEKYKKGFRCKPISRIQTLTRPY